MSWIKNIYNGIHPSTVILSTSSSSVQDSNDKLFNPLVFIYLIQRIFSFLSFACPKESGKSSVNFLASTCDRPEKGTTKTNLKLSLVALSTRLAAKLASLQSGYSLKKPPRLFLNSRPRSFRGRQPHKESFIALFFILISSTTIFAGNETYNGRIMSVNGGMVVGKAVDALDARFSQMPTSASNPAFVNTKVDNYVTLGVDHNNLNAISSYDLDFYISYTYYDAVKAPHTFATVLNISYNPAANYIDKSVFKFNDGYDITATITDVKDHNTNVSTTIPENLFLEVQIDVERYYSFDVSQTPGSIRQAAINPDNNSNPNELEISWDNMPGAEEYQLEWTFVNDYKDDINNVLSYETDLSVLNFDFQTNSTRINTTKNFYNISLVFEHGYLIYRVRAIGRSLLDPSKNIYGKWSLAQSGMLTAVGNMIYTVQTPHQEKMNWQYSATYAEEGKKKEVVSYFDGSMRNRQTVSKLNTNNEAIVGETIYDNQGRGAIQVLPAPANNPVLSYYKNFSLSSSSTQTDIPYGPADFDKDAGACGAEAGTMKNTIGASKYYSNDPTAQGQQAYVPDAAGYPFTQIEYEPDNTGRIRRQSGPGPDHALGTILNPSHETKYFYGQPQQEQLDRLFGSEAGDAVHYKKNMVIDANGQISVSYLDQQGRVVATSLAGEPSTNTDHLESAANAAVTVTADLFSKDANGKSRSNKVNIDGDALVFNSTLLVANAGIYAFDYNLNIPNYAEAACSTNLCMDCTYDLEIDVKDECGFSQITGGAIKQTIGSVAVDLACNASFTAPPHFDLNLKVGSYSVSKKLSINKEAFDFYMAKSLDPVNNTCIKTLTDFTLAAYNNTDFSGCDLTCDICSQFPATLTAYQLEYPGASQKDYDMAIAECKKLCEDENGLCEAAYETMLSDVSPGGQYAQYKNEKDEQSLTISLSLFNPNNKLPKNIAVAKTAYWKKPMNGGIVGNFYLDEDGTKSKIYLRETFPDGSSEVVYEPAIDGPAYTEDGTGLIFTYPENLLNVSDFINSWQASWATALVEYHPEYAYYEWCNQNSETYNGATLSSEDFDNSMYNTKTLDGTNSPTDIDGAKDLFGAGLDVLTHDPYFLSGGLGYTQLGDMTAKLASYSNNYSLKKFVYMANHCVHTFNQFDIDQCMSTITDNNAIINDTDWKMYRNLYMAEKQKLQQKQADKYASYHTAFNKCIGAKNYNPFASYVPEFKWTWTSPDEPCGYSTYLLYLNKIKRFRHNNDISDDLGLDADGDVSAFVDKMKNQTNYEMYFKTGQCPLAFGLQSLLNKLSQNNQLLTTTSLDGYVEFTRDLYSAVGGNASSYESFTWSPNLSGNVLTCTFHKGTVDNCSTNLTIPDASFTWSDITSGTKKILSLQQLNYTNQSPLGTYNFQLTAMIDNLDGSPIQTVILTGTTCIQIGECTFNNVCQVSPLAQELQTLMSGLASTSNMANTSPTYIDGSSIGQSYLSPTIIANLGTPGSNWKWYNITDPNKKIFEIADLSTPLANKIRIVFDQNINFASFIKFGFISPVDDAIIENFTVAAYSSSGTTTTLTGNVYLNSASNPLNMGACYLPVSASDKLTPIYARGDLEKFLNALAVKSKLNSPTSSPYDLTYEPAFTNILRSDFGSGSLNWTGLDNASANTFTGTIHEANGTASCNLVLKYPTGTAFSNINGFTNLIVDETNLISGKAYDFTINASLTNGTTVMLTGTSCFQIDQLYHPKFVKFTYNDNLVKNGDFEQGNIDFVSEYSINMLAYLMPGQYSINSNPRVSNPQWEGFDHTTGYSKMMLIDGVDIDGVETKKVWSETITNLSLGTKYKISVWVANLWYGIPAQLNIKINNVDQILSFSVPSQPNEWKNLNFEWIASSNSAKIDIYDIIFQYGGNDFALDDIYFGISGTPVFIPLFPPEQLTAYPPEEYVNPCHDYLTNLAIANGTHAYNEYIDGLKRDFKSAYLAKCLATNENFTMNYTDKEYHYTLYYYDQGGNLVRTIPPAGVNLITDPADFVKIKADRTNGTHNFFTNHTLPTTYQYNSLNQLVKQSTPDNDNINKFDLAGSTGLAPDLTVNSVQFTSASNAYLVGNDAANNGHIYLSNDGGKTWAELTSIGITDLKKVQMLDVNNGFAVGANGKVFKTINGGSEWTSVPTGTTEQLNDLYFSNAQTGIIAGNNGKIFYTSDGGSTWNQAPGITGNITGISFPAGLGETAVGYASVTEGQIGKVYNTSSGGRNWALQSNVRSPDLRSVQMIDNFNGFASGIGGTLLKTSDGGVTWNNQACGISQGIEQIHFKDASNGSAILSGGELWKTSDAGNTWTNTATVGTFKRFHFYDANNGYAVGNTGAIVKTGNSGSTWSGITSPSTNNLISVYFIDATNGYVSTANGELFRTSNSGSNWSAVNTSVGNIVRMHFADVNAGTVLTDAGNIYSVTAASSTPVWSPSALLSGSYNDMDFFSPLDGYAIATDGKIAASNSGGASWNLLSASYGSSAKAVFTKSATEVYVVGDNGNIFITSNSGTAWMDRSNSGTPLALNAIHASSATTVYAVGNGGTVLKTIDGGSNWSTKVSGTSANLYAVKFSDATNGLMAGANGTLLKTVDGGINFTLPNSGTTVQLNNIALNSSTSYVCGNNQTMIRTTSNGDWVSDALPAGSYNVNGVSLGATIPVAVGNGGKILRYNSATSTWVNVTDIKPPVMKATYFIPATSTGYAVGNAGSILKTIDNGTTWSTLVSGTTIDLQGVYFINASKGFVIGKSGTLLQTLDGLSWTPVSSGTTNDLNDIFFGDATHGYIVGSGGKLIRYNDASWQTSQNISPQDLKAAYFMDNTGYVAGSNGAILKTTDYGLNWLTKTSGTTANLKDIYFRDNENGYAIGDGGIFLKTTNGGLTWEQKNAGAANLNTLAFGIGTPYNGFVGGAGASLTLNDESNLFSQKNYYDELGRLIASQNAKQFNKSNKAYSYTKYDGQGRIIEVGEVASATDISTLSNIGGQVSQSVFAPWLSLGTRTEITQTTYDAASTSLPAFVQENLRGRVSGVNIDNDGFPTNGYDYATHFSYDIHGNVKSLLQDNAALATGNAALAEQRYKRMDYEYDLVSGNVKAVHFQDGQADQFHHKYEYDADNRITNVYTSKDRAIWDHDAKYFYLRHGPLARTELGDQKVQAMDYAYTIQGWIKGVNSNVLNPTNDIGKDGLAGTINANFAKDAYGYSLGYYNGDYKGIGGTDNFLASTSTAAYLSTDAPNLFNGNISSMVSTITDPTTNTVLPQMTAYKYDQLNRITQMRAYRDINLTANVWNATNDNSYQTNVAYDANGNILKMKRNGYAPTAVDMDSLTYKYETIANGYTKNTNKLRSVRDIVTAGNYGTDIDNQSANNYSYDEIGNLKGDVQEEIQNIEWTVYGKVKKVTRTTSSTKDDLEFMYDASGNRVAKIKKPHATLSAPNTWISTYYVRDASGNIMATYDKTYTAGADVVKLDEQYVYGSSRLGLLSRGLNLSQTPEANKFSRTLGQKQFEMSNHLGNVLTVVSDRKILSSAPSSYRLTGINQDFNNGTTVGWDTPGGSLVSNSNNRLQVSNSNWDEAPYYRLFQDIVAPGSTYSITFDLEAASAMIVKCRIWDVDDGYHLIKEEIYNIGSPGAGYTINFSTSCSSTLIDFYSFSSGTFYVDNIRDTPPVAASYTADVKSSSDYYAFGEIMPGRGSAFNNDYRFGFNGKESDKEMKGIAGASYDYGFRIYDPRLGRFLSTDPIQKSYPWLTPYQFASNTPIQAIDLDGKEAKIQRSTDASGKPTITIFVDVQVKNKSSISADEACGRTQQIAAATEKAYTGTINENGVEVAVTTIVRAKEVGENDRTRFGLTYVDMADISDPLATGITNRIGNTQRNQIKIGTNDIVNPNDPSQSAPITGTLLSGTGAHEFGHALNLIHVDDETNLMDPGIDVNGMLVRPITPEQLKNIVNTIEKQQPKKDEAPSKSIDEVESGGGG